MNDRDHPLPTSVAELERQLDQARIDRHKLTAIVLTLISDLEAEIGARYEFRNRYAIEMARYNRAMEPIVHARRLLSAMEEAA